MHGYEVAFSGGRCRFLSSATRWCGATGNSGARGLSNDTVLKDRVHRLCTFVHTQVHDPLTVDQNQEVDNAYGADSYAKKANIIRKLAGT